MIAAVLVKTKLYLPLYRPDWVPRPDLLTRLNLSFQRRLTVLSAPAGFGKTSLLRAWIQHELEPEGSGAASRFAWLALDEGDQDARRFLTYFTGALNSIGPVVSTEEPANFQPTQPVLQRSLDLLLNEVEAFCAASAGTHLVLVLDDYHLIAAEPVHQILAYWLERQPDQVHLVIATRADPPLPLARLRARGQLLELRAEELRFKKDEIQQYLHQSMGIHLDEKDLALLADRTEGWIAGLQMAALAMLDESSRLRDGRSLPDPASHVSSFVHRLSGSNRYIMDFLVKKRKAFWQQVRQITPPPMIPYRKKYLGFNTAVWLAETEANRAGENLKGVPVSPGRVTAPARVLHGPEEFDRMRLGEVLVAGTTTPAWTPLFATASAVVTDIGGPLSHGSIVAREYGIPAVMGTGVATRRICSGQIITVDGSAGSVALGPE